MGRVQICQVAYQEQERPTAGHYLPMGFSPRGGEVSDLSTLRAKLIPQPQPPLIYPMGIRGIMEESWEGPGSAPVRGIKIYCSRLEYSGRCRTHGPISSLPERSRANSKWQPENENSHTQQQQQQNSKSTARRTKTTAVKQYKNSTKNKNYSSKTA